MNVCGMASAEFEIGITTAEPFENIVGLLSSNCPFCEKDVRKRIYPQLTMKDAKRIICVLFPYKERHDGVLSGAEDTVGKGKIVSGDVWLGADYHIYINGILSQICAALKAKHGGEYMHFCDTGPLVDKEIAVRAGLGEYGRNSLVQNDKYGSYFYIGYILTNRELKGSVVKETRVFSSRCNGCYKCISACPANAISLNKPLDYEKCVSYISQKKGALTREEERLLGDTIYGCHICQSVCPANDSKVFAKYVDLSMDISNKEFKRKFGNTAAGFIGKKRFVRNAMAVLDNIKNAEV